MKISLMLPVLALTSIASCAPDARSPDEARAADRARATEQLEQAAVVLADVARSGKMPVAPREGVQCIVVVPALVSGGLIVGARHGDGVATCRTHDAWSAPAFVSISGGSAGLQIGVESADVVMLVRSARGMSQLFRSSFELAADTSAAAGPVGATAQAATDATMTAEIVSFARSRGLFAGVELSGATMSEDRAAAVALYGGSPDLRAILRGEVAAPREASAFLDEVRQDFPRR